MSEWITSGRSSCSSSSKYTKCKKQTQDAVFLIRYHILKDKEEKKICTGPVFARSVFWLAVLFIFSSSSPQVGVGGGGR